MHATKIFYPKRTKDSVNGKFRANMGFINSIFKTELGRIFKLRSTCIVNFRNPKIAQTVPLSLWTWVDRTWVEYGQKAMSPDSFTHV